MSPILLVPPAGHQRRGGSHGRIHGCRRRERVGPHLGHGRLDGFGLDLPEVSLVAILDADKEGFLRSTGSLIQTIGRAARHLNGGAILYADRRTDSMRRAIEETDRRRRIQVAYNEENHITPQSIIKPIDMSLVAIAEADYVTVPLDSELEEPATLAPEDRERLAAELEGKMKEAARKFEFERAAKLRDRVRSLRSASAHEETPANGPRQFDPV